MGIRASESSTIAPGGGEGLEGRMPFIDFTWNDRVSARERARGDGLRVMHRIYIFQRAV